MVPNGAPLKDDGAVGGVWSMVTVNVGLMVVTVPVFCASKIQRCFGAEVVVTGSTDE